MSRLIKFAATLSLLLLMFGTPARTADQVLIAAGSVWRYNDSGANLGTAWRAAAYNDAAWATGAAQLGYGDGDEATVLSYGTSTSNRRITYYFRRSFTVANPAALAALTLRYVRDDGCIVYLNGVEVARSNMPAGTVTYTTRATTSISGAAETAWSESPVDPSLLVAGTNVLAVELHQQSPSSSDISFNLELRATEAQAPGPTVALTAPANQTVTNTPSVTFNASVTAPDGLASATLHVGGPPLTAVFSGPLQIEDTQVVADTPTVTAGGGLEINVDGQTPHAHGLMKVPALIGGGSGQVPAGAIITSASLQVNCVNAGNTLRLFRLTESWVEDQATWNERATGSAWGAPGADGAASNTGDPLAGDCGVTGLRPFDITTFVQDWSNGAPNHGIVFVESGTDGVDFSSSESASSPVLTVIYKSPMQAVDTRVLSGTSATVSFTTTLTAGQRHHWNVRLTDATGRQAWAASDFEVTVDASAPNLPVLVAPANGATGVPASTTLSAVVSDPSGGPLTVTAALRRATQPEFTIIALPDTQHYSEAYPAIFTSQTQWIVNNKDARNIVFVTHEGDIVNNNTTPQWQAANTSMSLLDGVVPYGMGPGNHDQPTTMYNQYFPYTRYQGQPWYGGHYGALNDNNYQLFSGGGMDFVIVHLEFCPPAAAVSWAASVLQSYPDRIGMMTTHGYLDGAAQRTVHSCTNTQYLWDGLAVPSSNLRFMLSGHVHAESRRIDTVGTRTVFQMLADYQSRPSGGEGWLRILRFVPAEDTVYVQTYSPWLNRFESDADSEFTLDFEMGGVFTSAGTVTVASGATATIVPQALAAGTEYEWRVTVTNSSGKSQTGPVWRFTTGSGGPINEAPTAFSQSVAATEDTPALVTLTGSDGNGDPLTYTVVTGPNNGTLSGAAPTLTYQPAANSTGPDSFTFRAHDGQANSLPATVSITVQPVNDAPAAAGDAYSVASGLTLTVSAPGVLANDTDIDSSGLTAQLVSAPATGTFALNANGSFTYTAAVGFSGSASFTYRASDGALVSPVATVTITVTPVVVPDTTQPTVTMTAPATGATVSGTVTVSANASDNIGVAGVQFLLNGAAIGAEDTTAPYSITWASTSVANGAGYLVSARARDAAGNTGTAAAVTVTVSNTNTSLIAAYSFNEGTGTSLVDRSGRGHTGTISGAAWSAQGKFGGALSFDGVNDWVTVSDTAALDLTTGMTLEAWVLPSSLTTWRTVLMKERTGGLSYALYGSGDTSRASGYVRVGSDIDVTAPSALALNTWSHLAVTYDGTTERLFVNGVQVATRAASGAITTSTGALRIGGNSIWTEFFQGRIDEIRIYNRALTAAEIVADMAAPITP